MKKLFFILFVSLNVNASDIFPIAEFKVDFKTKDVKNKILDAIKNPELTLLKYNPIGGVVKNKKVEGSEISFVMTKKVVIISKTFKVNFYVDIHPDMNLCKKDEEGYLYTVDLNKSDDIVADNIERLEFNFCLKENSSEYISARVIGRLVKGANYSEPVGSIAKSTIEDQVDPFVAAIKSVVLNSN